MAWQPDHAHIVAEILAAELCADAERLRHFQYFLLHLKIDLNQPMKDILSTLSKHPIKTRLALTCTMIVARDSAHAKLRERLERGEPLPDYFKNHPIYYAGPAKTPEGYASGAFG